MFRYTYHTVDVFTDRRFGGNPLAVFPDATGLDPATMQALAAELNYSETTFVLRPENEANTARVRIFNRTSEMAFAGHPNVGTAFVLARLGHVAGGRMSFEQPAGIVEVRLLVGEGAVCGAEIDAPQPLQVLGELPPSSIADCLSIDAKHVVLAAHPPVRATVGIEFVLVEVTMEALTRAAPDLIAYRRLASSTNLGGRLSILPYARLGDAGVRARMFAPLAGTWEDPATGSAHAALAALQLSRSEPEALSYEAIQGVEMGRPSRLLLSARRSGGAVRASVGGGCVSVFTGTIDL
ncbi:PhzF family phenazine biosynthesis protein [Sphingomonas sp.]|jgi:trans-2,3-dihydro-3-hydroxyanthranilate isomerase|uniref:PhzF family phenazine biosynthesis protein n=1 Tax=Sphingomonas sp. TaxID=28214 RepID=UPI002DF267C5|nr:PhzF family phenazine biosynthesis protein [Sphingomonas sp.]